MGLKVSWLHLVLFSDLDEEDENREDGADADKNSEEKTEEAEAKNDVAENKTEEDIPAVEPVCEEYSLLINALYWEKVQRMYYLIVRRLEASLFWLEFTLEVIFWIYNWFLELKFMTFWVTVWSCSLYIFHLGNTRSRR